MNVHRHAEKTLIALTGKLPVPASVYIQRLRETPAPEMDTAIELCRLQYALGLSSSGTNGDSLVVIIRGGNVLTAMLRRSWAQPFTPEALRVQEVQSWAA